MGFERLGVRELTAAERAERERLEQKRKDEETARYMASKTTEQHVDDMERIMGMSFKQLADEVRAASVTTREWDEKALKASGDALSDQAREMASRLFEAQESEATLIAKIREYRAVDPKACAQGLRHLRMHVKFYDHFEALVRFDRAVEKA